MITATSIPCTSAAFAELSAAILQAGKALRFQARGASMAPLLRDGDVLWVRPVNVRSVQVGDVVLCCSEPDHILVHRVVRKLAGPTGLCFTVQGDRLARPDGVIPGAQVYGRLMAIERGAANIEMDRPLMRMLSGLVVLRSRWNLGRGRGFGLARRLVSKLPGLSRYLA